MVRRRAGSGRSSETGGCRRIWLAERSGIASRTLARRLHSAAPRGLDLNELARIADALQVNVHDLIPGARGTDTRTGRAATRRG